MLNVTPEFAGLIAQAFPTLMIAILIEGRVSIQKQNTWGPWFNLVAQAVRGVAVVLAMGATFQCLGVASGTTPPSAGVNVIVTVTAWVLMFAFCLAAGHIIGNEKTGLGEQLAKGRKAKKPAKVGEPASSPDPFIVPPPRCGRRSSAAAALGTVGWSSSEPGPACQLITGQSLTGPHVLLCHE